MKDINDKDFEVGDVVVADDKTPLRSGCGWYDCAVVVRTDPLALVSEETDMLWSSTVDDMLLEIVGKADAKILKECMKRIE
jgi:hypothetical protein